VRQSAASPSSLRRCSPPFPKEVDASHNFLWLVGFFERTIVTEITCLVGSSASSGGQDHINIRVMLASPTSKTKAIHSAAQPNFRKDNVDLLPGTQYGHDVSGGDALENLVSAIAEIACNDHPDQDVGFHDENRAWYSAVSALVV